MKILYEDLLRFLNDKPSIEHLSEKLFQLGHEHEIENEILDIEITPNRGDCLSLAGLARDLYVFFGKSKAIKTYNGEINDLELKFKNHSKDDCQNISFLEIEIESHISEYKSYLNNYFNFMGVNKVNFFTDVSNYISYELGQPTHCFDRNLITNNLEFETRLCNENFETLLGSEIKLEGSNSVFTINNDIISLAGIMGGKSTACSSKTRKVLVECAYFNPEAIIGKSIKYNINSDAAYKFERGVDRSNHEFVLRRFIQVVSDHANVKSLKMKTFSYKEAHDVFIDIDIDRINKILGTSIKKSEYIDYLLSLGFDVTNIIKVPSFRNDISTQNDLAEEIARVIGFNNIDAQEIKINKIHNKSSLDKVFLIESFLREEGFNEVINFPFTSVESKKSIQIDNPLDSNKNNLRTSLKESLINNLIYNERRQHDSIKLFEISDIYSKDSEIKKNKKLGLIISGRKGNNYAEFSQKLDSKYLNLLLKNKACNNFFVVEQLSRENIDTKKKEKIFYVEAQIDQIPEKFFLDFDFKRKKMKFIKYKKISDYPSSTRDFSFSISNPDKVSQLIEKLAVISDDILKNSFLFDFYVNKETKIVKLGYRFVFQSKIKTLSEKEVNSKIDEILREILKIDGVTIPGM